MGAKSVRAGSFNEVGEVVLMLMLVLRLRQCING